MRIKHIYKLFLGIILLSVGYGNIYAQAETDTFSLFFDLNVPELNRTAKEKIDSLLYRDAINANAYLLIIGYADYLGTEESNDVLSGNRAKNVEQYLLQMGVKEDHIKSCVGKGEINREVERKGGYATDRRVDIIKGKSNKIFSAITTSAAIVTSKKTPANDLARTIDSLKIGQTFILRNIFFHTGRHTVRDESITELDNLYQVMADNPALKIQIEGHVCCVPDNKDALDEDVDITPGAEPSPYLLKRLSLNRAMYIYYYLVKKGIRPERMKYEGYGRSRPLIPIEQSPEDEDKNKRVEIRILAK